jgi:hypothetical protein
MTRKCKLALFLAAMVLLWGAFALVPFAHGAAGDAVEAQAIVVASPASEKGLEELETDDPLAPEAAAPLHVVKSEHHKPVEHFKTASALEPAAPVPLSGLPRPA